MLKSDKQMDRVKNQIISEQVRIKKFEEKRQKMQSIKFAKAVKKFLIFRLRITKIKKEPNLKRKQEKELISGRSVKFQIYSRY